MMNKIFTILLLLISAALNATKYYVSPYTGNDSDAGTDTSNAWATWGKAFNSTSVTAGDTVYFRGGVYNKVISEGNDGWYYPSRSSGGTGYGVTRDGTAGNLIKYWNYPGETPILDCNETDIGSAIYNYGIRATGANYIHFKGLTIRNVRQYGETTVKCWGFQAKGNGTIVENCTVYNVGGAGFFIGNEAGETIYVINCDAHHCCDSADVSSPGNDGYGFTVLEAAGSVYFRGCRAWTCGDDGFNIGILYSAFQTQYVEYDSCWAFDNGMLDGGGVGFKQGWHSYTDGNLKQTYKHCISAVNRWSGFTTNDYYSNTYAIYCHIYNCFVYRNGYRGVYTGHGFRIQNSPSDGSNEWKRILKNNISYDNEGPAVLVADGAIYTHSNNSWDAGVTVSNADFINLDTLELWGDRQSNGSLPVISFGKLVASSDLINAGTRVIYGDSLLTEWEGDSVDIGWDEFVFDAEPSYPYISTNAITNITTIGAASGGYMISDGGGTISAKGLCYSKLTEPDLTDSVIVSGTGTDNFTQKITGLTGNTPYYVRAYATNETGTTYGAVELFTTSNYSLLQNRGRTIQINGKSAIYKTPTLSSDTLGADLVIDGGFSDAGAWTCGSGWSVTDGKAVASNVAQYISTIKQSLSGLEQNTDYKIVFTISDYSSGSVEVGLASNYEECCSSDGTYTYYINTSTMPNPYIAFRNYSASAANFKIDNVSVKKVL